MKTYTGARTFDGIEVLIDGRPLDPRRELKTFSLNSFEWSYEGNESAQLALALIADAVDEPTALRLAEPFMREIVANFDNEWEISQAQIQAAVDALDADLSNNP